MEEPQGRRFNKLLKLYYGSNEKENDPLSLNSEAFDPDKYMDHLYQTHGMTEIIDVRKDISKGT